MRSPTAEYKRLKTSLRGLKSLLARVPDTYCATNLQHLRVQSYLILAHAAFEEYLENISLLVLEECVDKFNNKRSMNDCIVSLITFETIAQFNDKSQRAKIRSEVVDKLDKFVNLAKRNHKQVIYDNHGIKLKDQKALLLPVGLDPQQIDNVTASSLDGFGTKRGKHAHTVKIQTTETKSSVLAETTNLAKGLKQFDQEAVKIINSA